MTFSGGSDSLILSFQHAGMENLGEYAMIVAEYKKEYVLRTFELTEERLEEMLPSEFENHCKEVMQKRIDARGMFRKDENES